MVAPHRRSCCPSSGVPQRRAAAAELRRGRPDPPAPAVPGLPEDVAAVRAVLQDGDEPTSWSATATAGSSPRRRPRARIGTHLVFVSSYLPEVGQSLSDFGDATPAPFLDIDPETGTFGVRPQFLAETFLQDCDPDIVARGRGTPAGRRAVNPAAGRRVAWHDADNVPGVRRRSRHPSSAQREFSRQRRQGRRADAGHHPFLSEPQAVADILTGLS